MRNAIHFLGGSIAVYTLMAACSSAGRGSRDSGPGPIAIQGGAHAQGGVNGATTAGASNPSDAQQGNGGSSMGGIVNTMMDCARAAWLMGLGAGRLMAFEATEGVRAA